MAMGVYPIFRHTHIVFLYTIHSYFLVLHLSQPGEVRQAEALQGGEEGAGDYSDFYAE